MQRRRRPPGARLGLALALCALAATGTADAQFRTGTTLVVVDVVVTGRDGKVVSDLTAADFEVLEDGERRAIEQLQFLDFRAAPAPGDEAEGVRTNAIEPGGIFALVLDELNLETRHTPALRRAAKQFIAETLQPGDYAVVLRSGVDSGMLFTADRDMLLAIADHATGRSDSRSTAFERGPLFDTSSAERSSAGMPSVLDRVAGPAGASSGGGWQGLEMLLQAVKRLGAVPSRRKAALWFSQGVSTDVEGSIAHPELSRTAEKLREIAEAARHGNVAVYGIDPRGLFLEDNLGPSPIDAGPDAGLDSIRDLSRITGGRPIINTNDVSGALAGVAAENRAYYLLGYVTDAPDTRRTRIRDLEVRVTRPGTSVLHRTAYVTGPPPENPPADPLGRLLPESELALSLTPALVTRPSGVRASFTAPSLTSSSPARYTLLAFDLRGRQRARQRGVMTAAGNGQASAATLVLPEGWYQLRLMVESEGRVGTVFADVNVP